MTHPNPLADFRKFLFVVWKRLNLDEEIASVTGQTLEMVQHYTKAVRQKANAIKALAARERVDKKLGHM